MDNESLRHLHALRNFIKNLIEQANRSTGCECSRPPSLLLVGPPGAGKTFLVKQLSNVCEMPLFGVHSNHLSGPFALRSLFEQARELDFPSLFFLDDLHHIYSNQDSEPGCNASTKAIREELFGQLGPRKLKIFDPNATVNPVNHPWEVGEAKGGRRVPGYPNKSNSFDQDYYQDNDGLIIIAATSSPWLLYNDHELLSRFRGVYLVGLPDREARYNILKSLLKKIQHSLSDKEIWMVADKTEGYTPSDLIILIKALNFKQYSILFSMAGAQEYEGSSGDEAEECISSSEITEESDTTESDLDSLPEGKIADLIKNSDPSVISYLLATGATEVIRKPKSQSLDEPDIRKVKKVDEKDREISEEITITPDQITHEKNKESEDTSVELTEDASFNSAPSPDSALGHSKCSEEESELRAERLSDCDSNLSAKNESETSAKNTEVVKADIEFNSDLEVAKSDNDLGSDAESKEETDETKPLDGKKEDKNYNSLEDVSEIHFKYHEPPDVENKSGDSDRESDGEQSSSGRRRVNFSGLPMEPLSVDIEDANFSSNQNAFARIADTILNNDSHQQSSANALLRSLLAGSVSASAFSELAELGSKSDSDKPIEDYGIGVHGNIGLGAIGPAMGSSYYRNENSRSYRTEGSSLKDLLQSDKNKTSTPEPSDSLNPSPASITPTPSELTSGSEDSSGSGRRNTERSSESDNKKPGSESSYEKSDTMASSDISTANGTETGETLTCRSDSEERLRNLSGDTDQNVASSEDEVESKKRALGGILNVDNLSNLSIHIITVADVMEAISKIPRSVSNEEINKYTAFMRWFANVAKSACPHNCKDNKNKRSPMDDVSIASTASMTPSQAKKRKKPLKKVGQFLLKALMFILD